ncbi:hypothetical protein F4860DRAFT_494675 [Xylaria cubensis]|nr:hypothetical protein F4860DRAFT_494675 [Xylaria cubensis]
MSHPDNNPSLARRNLLKRRRNREDTLLKKAYELHIDHETEVYMVFHHQNDNKYRVFTTQPDVNFPPSLDSIKMMYPVPIIHTPDTLEALLEKRRKSSHADIANDDISAEIDILPWPESDEQGEDVGREIPGNQDPSLIQGNPDDDKHTDIAQDPFVLKPVPLPNPQTLVYRTRPILSSMSSSGATSPASSSVALFPHDQQINAESKASAPRKTPRVLAVHGGGIKKSGSPSGRGGLMKRGYQGRFVLGSTDKTGSDVSVRTHM